jgi:chitinase
MPTSRNFARTLCACLLALAPAGGAAHARPDDKPPPRVFLGYVFGSNDAIDFKLYTHLAHAFVTADADGRLNASRTVPSRDLTAQAHAAKVEVLLSLGGWGWDDQFAAIGRNAEAEGRFTAAVLKMVDEFDYDGIDFDWEYPDTAEEVVAFERMTRTFRAGVDALGKRKGRPMRITMAASSNPGTIGHLSTSFLVETMEWINVMTYDYAGDWTDYAGHNAPLFASSKAPGPRRSAHDTIEYLVRDRKIPADRLALGIPLYGRGFAVAEPYASTKGADKKRVPGGGYRNYGRLVEQGWRRVWDDETKTPWLLAPDHSAVVGYDDPESVAAKAAYANEHHLRGVFFWEVHADRLADGTNPLQEATRRVWEAGPKAP